MTDTTQVGFFGKVPALGDFVQRRLPRGFVDPWDAWLQQCVAASKSRLGEGWLETYLNSPLWRFALGRNVCGPTPWAGVIMPSVDRVGRYFPLTIAAPLPADGRIFALLQEPAWFERAEDLALSALEEQGFDLGAFGERVAELGDPRGLATDTFASVPVAEMGAGWQVTMKSVAATDAALLVLLEQLADERFVAQSLWWSDGSEHVVPSLLCAPGLPQPDSFTALLDGHFESWAWRSLLGTRASHSSEDTVVACEP